MENIKLIGQSIRRIRREKQLSLQALANKSGVAIGVLSQIERDQGNPSLKTLTRIHQALEVPLSALFEPHNQTASGLSAEKEQQFVRRQAQRPSLQFGSPLLLKEILSPSRDSRLQFMILTLLPGGSSGATPLSYAAEKGGLVLKGSFELSLGADKYVLHEGDSFQFDGQTPHVFSNPHPNPARLLWIIAYDPLQRSL